jgi:hypothetical protein
MDARRSTKTQMLWFLVLSFLAILLAANPAAQAGPSSGAAALQASPFDRALGGVVSLYDGRIVVFGGMEAGKASARVDLFDPMQGAWVALPGMSAPRADLSATLGYDGGVILAGGVDAQGKPSPSVEVYYPDEPGRNSALAPLAEARRGHSAALLYDGRLMVAGGRGGAGGQSLRSVEIFDWNDQAWRAAVSMRNDRTDHAVVVLDDGRVRLIGGFRVRPGGLEQLVVEEVYDPSSGEWREVLPGQAPPARTSTSNPYTSPDGTWVDEPGC